MRIGSQIALPAVLALLVPIATGVQAAPVMGKIEAHPAIWIVHGPAATAYLFGSIHVLPQNVEWHTPAIDAAISRADTFVFEAPLDQSGAQDSSEFIRLHGRLPDDETLPSLLDAKSLKDYRAALAVTQIPPDSLEHLRPWYAALLLEVAFIRSQHYSPESGVDRQVFAIATQEGKAIRYLESVGGQLTMLMPANPKLELVEFETTLKEFRTGANEVGPLVDAWAHADETAVGKLLNADLESDPGAKKTFIDDRNRAWLARLRTMLSERHIFFITVGAGHLSGPRGLPTLLRSGGYGVEGP